MDGTAIGFISIGVLVMGNIAIVAYTYGQLRQEVTGLGGRIRRLENVQNGKRSK